MMKRHYIGATLALLMLCAPAIGAAQDSAAGKLARVYTLVAKAGSGKPLADALKSHVTFRKAQGDPWTWHMYQVTNGDGIGNYVVRSGGHHWADFDSYEKTMAKLKLGGHFDQTVKPYLSSISSTVSMDDDAHSHWVENENYRLFSITRYDILPGKRSQFDSALEQIHKGLQKQKWSKSYRFINVVNGASGSTRILVLPREKWADFAPPSPNVMQVLSKQYGKEKAETMLSQYGSSYAAARSSVLRYLPDLSVLHDSQ